MENAKDGGVDGVKNRSGQWEGPGGGELNGCIMHQVHTSSYKGDKHCDVEFSFISIYNVHLVYL